MSATVRVGDLSEEDYGSIVTVTVEDTATKGALSHVMWRYPESETGYVLLHPEVALVTVETSDGVRHEVEVEPDATVLLHDASEREFTWRW